MATSVSNASRAMAEHHAFDSNFAQAGNLRVDTVEELFDFAVGFSRQPLPNGRRFAILTNAGGPGIMATDAATRYGFELSKLRPETLDALMAKLPPTAISFYPASVPPGAGVKPLNLSISEEARAGCTKITNGVKQQLPGMWPLGVEVAQPAIATGAT